MKKSNVKINKYADDYSLTIRLNDSVLITPMSGCATALFDFFQKFSHLEPDFPRKDISHPSDSLFDLYMEMERDQSLTWIKLRPLWLDDQWKAWICSGVISLYVPMDTIRGLLEDYKALSLSSENVHEARFAV